jgi:hypothetical protein
MKLRHFAVVVSCVVVGIVVGLILASGRTVNAQAENPGRWQLYHGSYGQQSIYAIKLNAQTGEAWVLTVKGGADNNDAWRKLPEEIVPAKK